MSTAGGIKFAKLGQDDIPDAGTDLVAVIAKIYSSISHLDRFELLAALSALQLNPANLSRTVRLEFISQIACLKGSNGTDSISAHDLEKICNRSVPPPITMQEDECGHPLTNPFPFIGGCYTVFTGLCPDQVFALRQLCRALFLRNGKNPLKEFAIEVYSTLQATLLLSSELARRFGLDRYERSKYSSDVSIPPQDELTNSRRRTVFTTEELNQLFTPKHTDPSCLGPLITQFAGLTYSDVRIENGLLLQRPIVQLGDAHVVAIPGMLLPAVRHWIICSAIARGLSEELAHALHHVVESHVRDLFKLSSCPPAIPPISHPKLMAFQSESFYSLDTDKILHVLVTTDSLDDYDLRDPFGTVDASKAENCLTARIKNVRSFMRSRKRIRGVLSLVVSQGVGRTSWYDGSDPDSTEDNHLLRFSAEALELVTLLDGENQHYLWQFAVARDAAFSDTSVFITDTLSEYGLFRAHNSSFYLSDKAAPKGLWIASDHGDKIRVEYGEKLDLHTAPAYWQSGQVEVALLRQCRKVPIYFPFRSPSPIPSFLVEGYACPVWVASSTEEGCIGDAHTEIAESVAYWLWQLCPTIGPVLSAQLVGKYTILIHIAMEPLSPDQLRGTPQIEELVITSDRCAGDGILGEVISITLPSEFIAGCRHPENDYERLLCTAVLRGLAKLGDEESPLLDEPTIRLAIDRHIPHGRKKHLVAIEASKGSSLDPTGVPRLRDVQDANRNSVADRLGLHLRKKLSLPVGPIENEMLEKVLKECTSYCFTEIARLVDELSPRSGILERLILQHEACIHGRRRFELHMVPREQCYGDVIDISKERFEAEQQFSQVDPALRFLIEYVAANPPAGRRILSLSVIDELVALASYLID